MRWHAHYHTAGTGHPYQGRFKSFPVEDDGYTDAVCRYVERNPLRANWVELVNQAQSAAEVEAARRSVQRSSPFGSSMWQKHVAVRLGLAHTLRPPGRPKK